ncbi:MAG: hypothetical protein A2Y33_09925 [Spirochaetes bacterium GWF1_51_8]|nr:MAG: hypothetical protein A2Y33_09925 [Spirochaetes bacterium GWF1_51_8]
MKNIIQFILSLFFMLAIVPSLSYPANFLKDADEEESVDMDKYKKQKEEYQKKKKKEEEAKKQDSKKDKFNTDTKKKEEVITPEENNTQNNSGGDKDYFFDYDKPTKDVREMIFQFLQNPKGLVLKAGYCNLGFGNYSSLLDDTDAAKKLHPMDQLLMDKMNHLHGFFVGIELDHSFVDIRFSPNFNPTPDVLYIQVETGVMYLNREEKYSQIFYINGGVTFSGTIVSFSDPLITAANVTNFTPVFVDMLNTGVGITHVSTTIPASIGLAIGNVFMIEAGAFFNLGVMLPYYFTLDIGLTAKLEIDVVPNQLRLYVDWKYAKMNNFILLDERGNKYPIFFDTTFIQGGIGFQF